MAVPAPETIAFAVRGPIARSDLPGLCDRVCALFGRTHPAVALCDVSTVEPDAVTVDALARLQLAARRYGCGVRLCNASAELRELVSFMGLTDVLPCQPKEEEWLLKRPERSS
jgi:ABC-type transporter Mla MlaB component